MHRPGKQVQLAENEIRCICLMAKEVFMSQPALLELEAPIKICGAVCAAPVACRYARRMSAYIVVAGTSAGDIHGQYSDLLRLFEYGGFPPEANYLFLGDYVDRGKQSLETICLLLAFKVCMGRELTEQGVCWAVAVQCSCCMPCMPCADVHGHMRVFSDQVP